MSTKKQESCPHANMILCDFCGMPMCDDCGKSCTCDHVDVRVEDTDE